MFAKQAVERNAGGFRRAVLGEVARSSGLDESEFQLCMVERTHVDAILSEQEAGAALGVTGTPTVFVNGQKVELTTLEALFTEIESAAGIAR